MAIDERISIHAALQALTPEVRARAQETERLRQVPADLMDRIKAAGLTRLAVPAALGGLELDPMTIVELIEEISKADGSTGWTTLICNSPAFLAWLDPDVATDLIGAHPNVASTSMFGPLGTGIPDGDDLVVTGRWPFSSGTPVAELFQVGIFVMDGDAPAPRADGLPDWRFAYLRRDEVEIDETWDAAGLRGTGSHDVVLDRVRIPAARTAMPIFDAARHDGPLWRLPFFVLARTIMVGFPLGVGRRALDEIEALAPTKRRGMGATTVAEDRAAQIDLARAEGALQSARAFVFEVLEQTWAIAMAGEHVGLDHERRVSLATQQAMRAAVDAVDVAFHLGGAGAVYDSHPLQRCFRDVHTGSQHIIFSDESWAEYSRHVMGVG